MLIKKNSLEKLEIEHYKFKRNFSLFNMLYDENDSLESFQLIDDEIILGNRNTTIELVIETSPFCYYCKKVHRDIEKLLIQARKKLRIVIRFDVNIEAKIKI